MHFREFWTKTLLFCLKHLENIKNISSLHWLLLHSNCSFLYNGVYYDHLVVLSICDVIVKKVPMENKIAFLWAGLKFYSLFAQKNFFRQILFCCRKYTLVYEKGIKEIVKKSVETTIFLSKKKWNTNTQNCFLSVCTFLFFLQTNT